MCVDCRETARCTPQRGVFTDRGDYHYAPTLVGLDPKNNLAGPVKLCETERRRQAFSLPRLKTMLATLGAHPPEGPLPGGDIERLPVVELRPFTQKEWRPAKSLPPQVLPDRSTTSLSAPLMVPKRAAPVSDYESWGFVDPDRNAYTVTPRGMDAPCPRAFSVAGDRMSSHPRAREQGTYAMPACTPAPGFVPKLDRERSTVEDIRCGTSQSAHYSCVKSALSDLEVRHQQTMQIHGIHLENPPRTSAMYFRPWECLSRSYHATNKENEQQDSARIVDNLYMKLEHIQNTYLDENIYDAFDRSQTLPSINVNRANMKRRRKDSRLSSGKPGSHHAHRLGVTNSLDLLSHYGTPIGVEQQLTDQLKHTLNSIRRSKPLTISGMKAIKNCDWNPTQGEQQITSGKMANTNSSSKTRSRTVSSKGNQGTHGWMSRTNNDSGNESMDDGNKSPIKNVDIRRSKLHSIRGSAIKNNTPNQECLEQSATAKGGHSDQKHAPPSDAGLTMNSEAANDTMSMINEQEAHSEHSKSGKSSSRLLDEPGTGSEDGNATPQRYKAIMQKTREVTSTGK